MKITEELKPELLPLIPEITRVHTMVILGVSISEDLRASDLVESAVLSFARSLRTLRANGLSVSVLHFVASTTTMTRLTCAAPVWWGQTSAKDKTTLDRFRDNVHSNGLTTDERPNHFRNSWCSRAGALSINWT